MSIFDERKNAFEAKFMHDAEVRFRVEAHRNRLLGEWAARQLGYVGGQANDLVREYSVSCIATNDINVLVAKTAVALQGKVSAAEIQDKLRSLEEEAADHITPTLH